MEQLKNENVSVKSDLFNRGCTEFFEPDIKGCYTFGWDKVTVFRFCADCKAGICPDFFCCALDLPDSCWYPLYYDPRDKYAYMREEVSHE